MIIKRLLLLSILTAFLSFDAVGKQNSCPIVRIVPERLPDLNIPRSGHNIFYANGELTVLGGHTTNFVPTPTAEYFADGSWHQMPMAYSHDNGFAVVLHSGEVIIGGGHEQPLGIGQTYMVERYTPATHSFEGFGCLDRKRTLANVTQLADGRVIIVGNHFADDAIGCYDGNSQIQHVKEVKQGHANPYILHTATDNVMILGSRDTHVNTLDTAWVDRVKGEAFREPLLEQWKPMHTDQPFCCDACAIDRYSYLLAATDKNGQLGIVLVRDTCFSLLPTICSIPMQSQYGAIFYKGPVVVDKTHQRGYIVGVDSLFHHQFVLAIDYARHPALLTLYYTDSLEHANVTNPIVTPDGDLILAGGNPEDNYKPLATVWCYHFGTATQTVSKNMPAWLWGVLTIVVVIAIVVFAYLILHRRRNHAAVSVQPMSASDNEELMKRIEQLIVHEQLFLNGDLKLSDVAAQLGTNRNIVSNCINSQRGCSFSQFINGYRVSYAMDLMRRQQEVKISEVWITSGFATESSFFRNFKAVTGMTPTEWKQKNN
jgi:AraC-like DNA-binding protein